MKMKSKFNKPWLIPLALVVLFALAIGIYYLPPVHSRLAWRVDELRTKIIYFFNPPSEAVFHPGEETPLTIETAIITARAEFLKTLTPQITPTLTPTAGPTLTPTATSTPLPATIALKGFKYEDQFHRWNYCGPTNFAMALSFWGWKGNRDVIGQAVMPGNTDNKGSPANVDKNVMPYEFQDYITANVPGITSVLRYGGNIDVIKRLVAGGFPVIAEKGYYEPDTITGKIGWMGHYQYITGYNDTDSTLLVQDTYKDGPNFKISYSKFMEGWRSFNYLFVVVYPTERESDVMSLLGPYADETWATKQALELATSETQRLKGIDGFFAWFNVGTSNVALHDYMDAATAYDQAFAIYANLGGDNTTRPYRMMWYQTGPYFAYYYSGRYQDVISLADTTLNDTIAKPTLEESLLWRGRAYYMSGNTQAAVDDYRAALKVHVNWLPAMQALQDLGLQP
jgi:hypothetical protein